MSTTAKKWTPEELDYLQEHWGQTSTPSIAKHLGRSINAAKIKAARIGLPGNPVNASEYITLSPTLGRGSHGRSAATPGSGSGSRRTASCFDRKERII